MKKRLNGITNFISFLKSSDVSLETKSLYLIVLYVMFIDICYGISLTPGTSGSTGIILTVAALVFFAAVIYIMNRFDETALLSYVVVAVINFLVNPLVFAAGGGVEGGSTLFFLFGMIITLFLIHNWIVYILLAAELIWYGYMLSVPSLSFSGNGAAAMQDMSHTQIVISFILAAAGPVSIFIYYTFCSERVKKQLEDSLNVIENAKHNKSRFLANVTHEIRTPMNAIVGMNELILREELNPEARELAENIRQSSNQLLKIINNILEFSKLDSDRMRLYPQKYDFKELMYEIITDVSAEYASTDNDFYARIDPEIPRMLFGDDIRIKQVFMYLLFSTVNKIPHSRLSMDVTGEVDTGTNSVMIRATISEAGFGLSKAEIDAMMSAYTRYDSRQKSDYKGMGLELSICKEILELMGGNLYIESVEGVGMSVHFEFLNYIIEDAPIVKVSPVGEYSILVYTDNAGDQNIWVDILSRFQLYPNFVTGPNSFRQAIENRRYTHIFIDDMFYPLLRDTISSTRIENEVYVLTEAGSIYSDFDKCKILRKPITSLCVADALNNTWDENAYKLAQKHETVTYPEGRVMIVDDSIVNLRVLEAMLQTFRINITSCKSGAEALDILEREDYDLIILDRRMPGMDGTELLHLIRKMDNVNAMAPILCATADFGTDVSRELLNEGFQNYLAKPVRKFYLEKMLRKYMPAELAENVEEDGSEPEEPAQEPREETSDPRDIRFEEGLAGIGGDTGAFSTIVNAYYREGTKKLELIPGLLAEGDIRNYAIEVHGLKSSSAAIGAGGMSVLFRELEFAAKADNIEFIESRTGNVMSIFADVLGIVKGYLTENGMFETEDVIAEPEGEEVPLDMELVRHIADDLANFNIRETEQAVAECVTVNYGHEINGIFRQVRNCLDMFDYRKAKDLLEGLMK